MSNSLAQDAIALLIDLANQGEIDPWDVQVIDVIDRYLSKLLHVHDASQVERQVALSQSGQAFLYASMLVLLKAESLIRSESSSDETQEYAEDGLIDLEGHLQSSYLDGDRQMPLKLERQLRRRAVAPVPKKRRVTLQELIDQLRLISMAMETHLPKRKSQRHSSAKSRAKAVRDLTELAHQENLSEIASALDQFLTAHWPGLPEGQDWLELDDLLDRWAMPNTHHHRSPPDQEEATKQQDRVGVFWALLLLSAQSKVELVQEQFYQDLKIRALPTPVSLQVNS